MKRTLVVVVGATLLGIGLLATSVFAQAMPPMATTQATDQRVKPVERLNEILGGLVQKGVITAQQKDAILDAVKTAAERRGFDRHEFVGDVAKAASDYLGVSVADLRTQVKAGKSLGEIANATPGKSRDGLIAALDKAADARIKAAVDAGKITQAQADQLRPKVQTAIVKIVDHKRATPATGQ